MNFRLHTVPSKRAEKPTSLAQTLQKADETCRRCQPLTPTICMTKCDVWKLKNEFRKLYEKMRHSTYMKDLLNTIKNNRRLKILNAISNKELSIIKLQQKLKEHGYQHSQQTITEEYLTPLIEVGLAREYRNKFYTTLFGYWLNNLVRDFNNLENILPPHSECYEEITLSILLNEPNTYETLEKAIPVKNLSRILNRLKKAGLIETAEEKDYVFYFRTRRDPNKVKFSPTEQKVYHNIPAEGISARKLAEQANISLRRTYKYLKRLKRKKLVFTRKKSKLYTLTPKGVQIAKLLQNIRELVIEALTAGALLAKDEAILKSLMPGSSRLRRRKKRKEAPPLTVIPTISPR
jgi:predicted transcriptional regulator/ribosomal protein S8